MALQTHALEPKAYPSSTRRHNRIPAAPVFIAGTHTASIAEVTQVRAVAYADESLHSESLGCFDASKIQTQLRLAMFSDARQMQGRKSWPCTQVPSAL